MRFFESIGIDSGSSNTCVYVKKHGLVFNEPTVVTFDKITGKILASGTKAKEMTGRTCDNSVCCYPIVKGVVTDFDATCAMLKYAIKESLNSNFYTKPKAVISIPCSISEVEKCALLECAIKSGIKEVYLIKSPVLSLIANGIDAQKADGHMVVDIGAGISEIAIISLGKIVFSQTLSVAGNTIDDDIFAFAKNNYNLICGKISCERAKFTQHNQDTDQEHMLYGYDRSTNMPSSATITFGQLQKIIESTVNRIIDKIKDTLEECPPELSADIMRSGILLCGGCAKLYGIADYIKNKLSLKVTMPDNPHLSVVEGLGKVLESPREYSYLLSKYGD